MKQYTIDIHRVTVTCVWRESCGDLSFVRKIRCCVTTDRAAEKMLVKSHIRWGPYRAPHTASVQPEDPLYRDYT